MIAAPADQELRAQLEGKASRTNHRVRAARKIDSDRNGTDKIGHRKIDIRLLRPSHSKSRSGSCRTRRRWKM